MRGIVMISAVACYALVPVVMKIIGIGEPIAISNDLMVLLILLLATRLTIVLANSCAVACFPICIASAVAAQHLILEAGLVGNSAQIFQIATAIAVTVMIYAAMDMVMVRWRGVAVAGLNLSVGMLILAFAVDWMSIPFSPSIEYSGWLSFAACAFALMIVTVFSRSAAYSLLSVVRSDASWAHALGVRVGRLSRHIMLVVGLLVGLSTVPIWQGNLIAEPETWPSFWLGLIVVVILAGRSGIEDCFLVALPVMVFPMILNSVFPELPDLLLPAAIVAIAVGTFVNRGRRPGEIFARRD